MIRLYRALTVMLTAVLGLACSASAQAPPGYQQPFSAAPQLPDVAVPSSIVEDPGVARFQQPAGAQPG